MVEVPLWLVEAVGGLRRVEVVAEAEEVGLEEERGGE